MINQRAVIHIGMHKTGSTSIQQTLFENASQLARHGFCYPTEGTRWWGHHPVAWAAGVPHPSADKSLDVCTMITSYLAASHEKTLVLSSEDFYGVQKPAESDAINLIAKNFNEVEVVLYIRHPVDWVVSAYKWNVEKDPRKFRSISDYISRVHLQGWFNYPAVVRRWQAVSNAKVVIRPYVSDVVGDFARFIGAPDLPRAKRTNSSIRGLSAVITSTLAADIGDSLPTDAAESIDRLVRDLTDNDLQILTRPQYDEIMRLASKPLDILRSDFPFPGLDTLLEDRWRPCSLPAEQSAEIALQALLNLLQTGKLRPTPSTQPNS